MLFALNRESKKLVGILFFLYFIKEHVRLRGLSLYCTLYISRHACLFLSLTCISRSSMWKTKIRIYKLLSLFPHTLSIQLLNSYPTPFLYIRWSSRNNTMWNAFRGDKDLDCSMLKVQENYTTYIEPTFVSPVFSVREE
jgi:hypothetical protein